MENAGDKPPRIPRTGADWGLRKGTGTNEVGYMLALLLSELLGQAWQSGELLADQSGRLAAALRIQAKLRRQMDVNPAQGADAPEPKWVLANVLGSFFRVPPAVLFFGGQTTDAPAPPAKNQIGFAPTLSTNPPRRRPA